MSGVGDSVLVTTVVAVDPATAFEAFTTDVDAWWGRGPRFRVVDGASAMRFEPGAGGRLLEVVDSGAIHERGRVRVWDPPKRLIWRSLGGRESGPETEVEVSFESTSAGTRVTVEHRGWDRVPRDHPVRHGLEDSAFANLMGRWWADLLAAHRAHAERGGSA
jgi:uncharacterized protein YndB with AHSA1/START domain